MPRLQTLFTSEMNSMLFARLLRSVAVLLVLSWDINADAAIVTKPTSLVDGDQYRIVFVTSGTRNALSANIAEYNSFVTQQANLVPELAALNTTWKVIGSTTTVNARDNTGTNPTLSSGVPFYRLDGGLVAANNAELWSSNIRIPLNITQTGLIFGDEILTGTFADGTTVSQRALGNSGGIVQAGLGREIDLKWISYNQFNTFQQWPFYAMSGVITVGSTVPEPNSMMLLGFSLFLWSATSRRFRKGLT
jgi:hypothetical protein